MATFDPAIDIAPFAEMPPQKQKRALNLTSLRVHIRSMDFDISPLLDHLGPTNLGTGCRSENLRGKTGKEKYKLARRSRRGWQNECRRRPGRANVLLAINSLFDLLHRNFTSILAAKLKAADGRLSALSAEDWPPNCQNRIASIFIIAISACLPIGGLRRRGPATAKRNLRSIQFRW